MTDASANEPRIEPATLEDLPKLAELLAELFSEEADFEPNRPAQERGLRLILESPNRGRIFVMRQGRQILAMANVLFTISTAHGGHAILLEDVIVLPEYRGMGVGTKIMNHVIDFARRKKFVRIMLLTDRIGNESQHFFKRFGFVTSEMIPMRLVLEY